MRCRPEHQTAGGFAVEPVGQCRPARQPVAQMRETSLRGSAPPFGPRCTEMPAGLSMMSISPSRWSTRARISSSVAALRIEVRQVGYRVHAETLSRQPRQRRPQRTEKAGAVVCPAASAHVVRDRLGDHELVEASDGPRHGSTDRGALIRADWATTSPTHDDAIAMDATPGMSPKRVRRWSSPPRSPEILAPVAQPSHRRGPKNRSSSSSPGSTARAKPRPSASSLRSFAPKGTT